MKDTLKPQSARGRIIVFGKAKIGIVDLAPPRTKKDTPLVVVSGWAGNAKVLEGACRMVQ
jgi:hypothetical protein